ncbi:MAG: hypothetical protein IKC51_02920, partial [Myxococcaceae bacterium]|nr:hypothetical protein [Myxococcaceae bacterium]
NFRARAIFETNLRTSWAAGRFAQMDEIKSERPFWQYRHGGSAQPRPEHLAWDGLILHADHPWWRTHYPPNGFGCTCHVVCLSAREVDREWKKAGGKGNPPKLDAHSSGIVLARGPRGEKSKPRLWTPPDPQKDLVEVKVKGRGLVQVPRGIDPGWDYVPGSEAFEAQKREEIQKRQESEQRRRAFLAELKTALDAALAELKAIEAEAVAQIQKLDLTDAARRDALQGVQKLVAEAILDARKAHANAKKGADDIEFADASPESVFEILKNAWNALKGALSAKIQSLLDGTKARLAADKALLAQNAAAPLEWGGQEDLSLQRSELTAISKADRSRLANARDRKAVEKWCAKHQKTIPARLQDAKTPLEMVIFLKAQPEFADIKVNLCPDHLGLASEVYKVCRAALEVRQRFGAFVGADDLKAIESRDIQSNNPKATTLGEYDLQTKGAAIHKTLLRSGGIQLKKDPTKLSHPLGAQMVDGVFSHESGHALDNATLLSGASLGQSDLLEINHLLRAAFFALAETKDFSGYAASRPQDAEFSCGEWLAEAFAEYNSLQSGVIKHRESRKGAREDALFTILDTIREGKRAGESDDDLFARLDGAFQGQLKKGIEGAIDLEIDQLKEDEGELSRLEGFLASNTHISQRRISTFLARKWRWATLPPFGPLERAAIDAGLSLQTKTDLSYVLQLKNAIQARIQRLSDKKSRVSGGTP